MAFVGRCTAALDRRDRRSGLRLGHVRNPTWDVKSPTWGVIQGWTLRGASSSSAIGLGHRLLGGSQLLVLLLLAQSGLLGHQWEGAAADGASDGADPRGARSPRIFDDMVQSFPRIEGGGFDHDFYIEDEPKHKEKAVALTAQTATAGRS